MNGTIAEVRLFAGNFAPRTWALCNGQLLAISSNTALFSIIGTTYGGDGRTSFALPDLRGRVPIGAGNGPGLTLVRPGQKGGTENTTLNIQNLPAHNHSATLSNGAGSGTILANAANGNQTTATDHFMASVPDGRNSLNSYSDSGDTTMANDIVELSNISGTVSVGLTGGNQSIDIRQPQLGLNYIICLFGIYPSRS